jgi:hydrogenase expression/formation protein HypC
MCLAIPGQILSIDSSGTLRMGRADFGGVIQEVCLEYTPEIAVGDYAIVHVGFALSRIDEALALETLRTFAEMGILEEGLAEIRGEAPVDEPAACPLPPAEAPRR